MGLSDLRDGLMPPELVIEQLPRQLVAGDRTLRIQYRPIGEPVSALLVVVTDVTDELARQRAEQEAAAARAATANLPRVLYFDFDSYVMRGQDKAAVEAYSRLLVAQRNLRMSLEGHADERGGREYNLALGQKRAEAVAKAMELLGVNANQVEAVSFGEERPAETGSSEAAWAKNRRVELKDR